MRRKPECNFCECFLHAWTRTTRWGVVIVDARDAYLLMENIWCLLTPYWSCAYAWTWKKKLTLLHRMICPTSKMVDHIDGNGLNCRRDNLRPATPLQNSRHTRPSRNGTSRFLGVSWDSARAKWSASISLNGRRVNLGRFDREENAALAYNFAANEHFGEFARLNTGI